MKKATAIFICFMTSVISHADTEVVDGIEWTYTVSNGEASIGGGLSSCLPAVPKSTTGAITIPSSLGGKTVTSIGVQTFYGCSGLASVTIPNSVTIIGDGAFSYCSGLTSVTIPDSVTSIEPWAFSGCSGLTSVTIPDSVTSIGSGAFEDTPFFYNQPDGLVVFGKVAYKMKGVSHGSVTIPDSVTSIGDFAFEGCNGLTSVAIPDRVMSIGNGVFNGCSGLTTFTVGSGNPSYKSVSGLLLTKDGKTLVAGVNGDVTIPNGVVSIGQYAFDGRNGLTSVTISDGVTSIGYGAFNGCSGLTSVTIPDSMMSIGHNVFVDCSDDLFDTTTIPGVKMVDGWAVGFASSLAGYLDLDSVRGFGGSAFAGCSGLTSVTIPEGVSSIGDNAFSGCSGLTSVTIPDGVTSIGEEAFYGCSGLTSVTIPDSVTNVGDYAFRDCTNITSITWPGELDRGWAFNTIGDDGSVAFGGNSIKTIIVSKGSFSIGNYVFDCFSGVTNVVIPTSVTNIGAGAFYYCTNLTSVTIPDSVTSIGSAAFESCSGLTSMTIPDSVTSIGSSAFYGCSGLASVTIPDSVTDIGDCAFENCSNVTNLTASYVPWAMDRTKLMNISIPDGVTSIREAAFAWCSGLTNVTIPDSVTNIGISAFGECHSLMDVKIPNSVQRIEGGWASSFGGCNDLLYDTNSIIGVRLVDGWALDCVGNPVGHLDLSEARGIASFAFDGCSGLTSMTIGGLVTSIGDHAFDGCWNLSSVMFQGDCPKDVPYNIYEDTPGTLTTYVSRYASGWGDALSAETWNGRPIVLLDLADDEPPFDCIENPDGTVTLKEYKGSAVDEIYIPSSNGGHTVSAIAGHAFESCSGLRSVTIPATVTWLDDETFAGCSSLISVTYLGDAPDTGNNIYKGTPRTLVSYVTGGTIGWSGGISSVVPEIWNDRGISCEWTVTFDVQDGTSSEATRVVTNGCVVGELPAATRDGYEFLGWRMGNEASSAEVTASTIVTADMTVYASWRRMFEVAFYNNKGLHVLLESRSVGEGLTIGALPDAPEFGAGYSFAGWREVSNPKVAITTNTVVTGDMVVYAICNANTYTLFMDAQGGDCSPTSVEVEYGEEIGELPNPTLDGYTFYGWYVGDMKLTATTLYETDGDSIAVAHWTKNAEPTPTPTPTPELYEETEAIAGVVPATAASEYNGYLVSANGNVAGSIQVKVGKANAKTGLASVKATVVIGATKKSLKGADKGKAVLSADGPTVLELVGGEACEVVLGAEGLSGTYGSYQIDGARNFFTSKDKGEQGAANDVLSKWLGPVSVVWNGGSVNVSIAKKGKAKVKGTLANGTKVSAKSVFLVGEEWCAVPVAAPKAKLTFTLWLSRDGHTAVVEGLGDGAIAGKPRALKSSAKFQVGKTAALWTSISGTVLTDYIPDGFKVASNGGKWVLPKARKVVYKDGAVDGSKLGDNPSGLKLTYKAKDGSFKGSFKVYAVNGGKLKATTVNVTGVVINGVGYGTATIKKVGSVPIRVE